jgi:hypothetical protein
MREITTYSVQFILYIVVQTLILSHIEFGWGIHPMIYPLFILMLPFQMGTIPLLLTAFAMGIVIDFFMNTFGLHASAAALLAYIRPEIFRLFSPRDGYESFTTPSMSDLGIQWFLPVAGILTLIHHFWFFFLEIFKTDAWFLIARNAILSAIVTFLLMLIIQVIFFKKQRPL